MTTAYQLLVSSNDQAAPEALQDLVGLLDLSSSWSIQVNQLNPTTWAVLTIFEPEDMEDPEYLKWAQEYLNKVSKVLNWMTFDKALSSWRAMN